MHNAIEQLMCRATEWIADRPASVALVFEATMLVLCLPAILLLVLVGAVVYVCDCAAFLWDHLRFGNPD